jgi:hypothetical protein
MDRNWSTLLQHPYIHRPLVAFRRRTSRPVRLPVSPLCLFVAGPPLSFVGRRRRRRRRCASSPRRRRSPRHMHRIVVAAVATPRLAPVMVAVVVAAPVVAPRLLSVRQASSTKNVTKTTLSGQSRATTINPRTRRCVALPVVRSSAARYPARSQVAGLSSRRRAHLAACSALSSRRPPVWPAS